MSEFDGNESAWESGWGGYFEPPRDWYDENYAALKFDHYVGRSASHLVGKQLTYADIVEFGLDPAIEGKFVNSIGCPRGDFAPPSEYRDYAREQGLSDDEENVIRWAQRQALPEQIRGGLLMVGTLVLLCLIATGILLLIQAIV